MISTGATSKRNTKLVLEDDDDDDEHDAGGTISNEVSDEMVAVPASKNPEKNEGKLISLINFLSRIKDTR